MCKLLITFFFFLLTSSFSKELYESDEWRALLHFTDNNKSEITDPQFFLSEKEFSPKKEYEALLALLLSSKRCETECRFPARSRFLNKYLDLNLSFEHCQDLQAYLNESNGDSASVVLVSSFLGSPASYFGHSFIKLNKKNNLYFSHTIGFAADMKPTVDDPYPFYNLFMGKLKGRYLYSPYYQLLEQYSAIEQRSLVEYNLSLTKDEINNLRWHAYELRNVKTDYGLLHKNCAFELLWLLEVARPSIRLREHFEYYAVPRETIDVLKEQGLVNNISTRPSDIDSMYIQYRSLNQKEKEFFSEWKESDNKYVMFNNSDFNSTSKQSLAYLMNTYYDVAFKKYKDPADDFQEVKKIRYINPKTDYEGEPYSSLNPSKISVGRIENKDGAGTQIQLIPVLFNRRDERSNELSEETLEILSLKINNQHNNTRLESIDLLKNESFTRRYDFFSPFSWRVYAGANRSLSDRSLQPLLEVASGLSYGKENSLIYCLIQPTIYPLASTVGISAIGGIGYWIGDAHIGVDLKQNIIFTAQKPSSSREAYLSLPINKRYFIHAKYDFYTKESYLGATYRF